MTRIVDLDKNSHFFKGSSRALEMTLKDSDDLDAPPVDVDMTGYTLSFVLKVSNDSAALITKTSGGGGIVIATVKATVAISASERATLTPRFYVFDLVRTDSGDEEVLATGRIFLQGTPSAP